MVNIKIKQPKSDTKSTQRTKSITISTPFPMSNIATIPDNVFNLN